MKHEWHDKDLIIDGGGGEGGGREADYGFITSGGFGFGKGGESI